MRKPISRSRAKERLDALQEVSIELLRPRQLNETLTLIVQRAASLCIADAASLYILENSDQMLFEVAVNHSVGKLELRPFKISTRGSGLAAYVARTGETLRIDDVAAIPADAPYSFDRSTDLRIGYSTKSVLIQPLKTSRGDVMGVLQLLNRKHKIKEHWPSQNPELIAEMPSFCEDDSRLLQSFVAVASVALENANLYKSIEDLFEGFVKASVHAIEARDGSTRGHSERVAALTVDLSSQVSRSDDFGLRHINYTRNQISEIRYAALLHDFGKIGVREATLLKAEKLNPEQKVRIRSRFNEFKNATEIRVLRDYLGQLLTTGKPADPVEWARMERQIKDFGITIEQYWDMVLDLNKPTILDRDKSANLESLSELRACDCLHHERPVLEPDEIFSLKITKGSLTEGERKEIESHVVHTINFLKQIPWTKELSRIPEIAGAHHERLTGIGYPYKLKADQIPDQARMMAICDIYDALVASDRPYKKSLPPERALEILEAQSRAGDLDARFLKVFIEAKVYDNPLFKEIEKTDKKAA